MASRSYFSTSMRVAAIGASVAIIAAITIFAPLIASAQPLTMTSGPFVPIADEQAGEYRLIVQQSPERVILGTLAISVQIHDAESDASIPDAIVRIYGTPAEHGNRQVAPALNSPQDREYYVGRLEVEETGVWAIDVAVEHPEYGAANLTLAAEVFNRSRGGSNLIFGTILWGLVSLVFIGAVWHLISSSRKTRARLQDLQTD